ncbi:unnamed protein product [Heterobilharzia americana]|nr:unnamed protein product [Heterobilharzia americana]
MSKELNIFMKQSSGWQCGEMSDENTPVCKGTESIIFAWAMGAPTFKMPPDISHKVGQGTPTKYLVLQIHYKDSAAFQLDQNKQDKSGIKLTTQRTPTEKLAGVYVLVSDGEVLPKQTTKLEMSCMYSGEATIHPFAFRVHAHEHGVLNDGYVIANNEKYLIGSKSPQLPQTFYPVENKSLEINPGDTITARCKMINNENKPIKIGNTRYDEMCNFYIMYWVKSEDENQLYDPNNQLCFLEDDDIIEKELDFEKLLPSEPFLSDIHNNFGLGAYTPFDIGDDENVYFPETM